MIPKATFAKKVKDDNNDFKLAFCSYVYWANKIFARDNQTEELIISCNVAEAFNRQKLIVAELKKK